MLPPPFPRRGVPSPQARLEANATALRDEALALRRERAELARRNAALQGASICPAPGTPAWAGDSATHALGATPGRVAQVLGCPFAPQRSWHRAQSRRRGCGSGWRRRRSSGERCGHAGRSVRLGRKSSRKPCEGPVPLLCPPVPLWVAPQGRGVP